MYSVAAGDNFDAIARKMYGSETNADKIARGNPGVYEPLTPGTTIIIPPLPDDIQNFGQNIPFVDEDEVAVLIDGKRFRYWTTIAFSRQMDSFDEVRFSAPFDVNIPNFKENFAPFSFKKVAITIGGDVLFTGTMIEVTPNVSNQGKTVSVACYSIPGVLQDCTMPASAFPLEFNGQGLKDIATKIAGTFGIGVEFAVDQGAVFKKVAMEPGDKCFDFLTKLAQQRNLIISNTQDGKLLFTKSVDGGNPVALLQQGIPPLEDVKTRFDPQQYYSHITGIGHTSTSEFAFSDEEQSGAAIQFTVKNPHLTSILRPNSYTVDDTENNDIKTAVEAKIGRMFGNVASYEINVPVWRDSQGVLWQPNTTLKLFAPDAMIYSDYEFVIRGISFEHDGNSKTAKLTLAMPGTFSGKIPEALPWDA